MQDRRRSKFQKTRHIVDLLVGEAAVAGIMVNLITGVLLVKLALLLGGGPIEIGLLGAFPYLGQLMQIPSVAMATKFRNRKFLTLAGSFVYRVCLFALIFMPWLDDKAVALKMIIILVCLQNLASGWGTGPWNGWVRDLLHASLLGRVFGRRLNKYTLYGTCVALGAAFLLDYVENNQNEYVLIVISAFFATAFVASCISFFLLYKLPDAKVGLAPENSLMTELLQPLKDSNFRRLILFLLAMMFAMNLAVPFFPVYMLDTLQLPVSYVMGIWALGQFMQVPAYKWWGMVSDKYSHTTSLAVCLPFFVIGLLMWPLTTLPEKHLFTLPVLVIIHLLIGVGLAGVILSSQVIALKLAPKKQATSYVAAASMLSSGAAGFASILGGFLVAKLDGVGLTLNIQWQVPNEVTKVTAYAIGGYDFLFVMAAVLILVSSPLLATIVEKGKTPKYVVNRLMRHRALSLVKGMTTIAGFRQISSFPIVLAVRKKHENKNAEHFEELNPELREQD